MKTFQSLPLPALRPFVDRLWGWQSAPHEEIALPTLLPGTGAELYFHFGTPFRLQADSGDIESVPAGHLFCVRRRPIALQPTAGIGFIAVRFRIGALHRFTPIPAPELFDACLSVEQLWGTPARRLLRRLSSAAGFAERLAMIEAFLVDRLLPAAADSLVASALPVLYRERASLSIDALATRSGLGLRQLERRWRAYAGQSPSELKGLIRFQRTVRGLMLAPATTHAAAAIDGGYYDQAHFIRDFRTRVGMSPQRYLRTARTQTHFYNTSLRGTGILRTP